LLDGATGNISSVITAFGNFVVGGNYFVGFVIFAILVLINFIVITKGAGRVAEVGARFTLDAMPGKQMAIDAELNAGLIDKAEARKRRTTIEREADFYGSMDGASKFVRGDAIAGIVITIVNIVAGLMIGIITHDMSFAEAGKLYTLLTVGDGLVAQIPALIISVAAGIVVTRVNGEGGLSTDVSNQLLLHPKAIFVCAGVLVVLPIVSGLPFTPMLATSVGLFFVGRYAERNRLAIESAKIKAKQTVEDSGKSDTIDSLLHIDTLALEVGVGLIPLVDHAQDGEILSRIISARKQFATELGIVVPMVMVRDNIQLKPGEYQLLLRGNVVATGSLMPDFYLAMDPGEIMEPIQGIKTKEPAYGLDGVWIKPSQREEASFRGYTVVNCSTVVVTHLTKVITDHAHELLGRQEVQALVDNLKHDYPKLVEEVLSADRLTLGDIVKILQNLLRESVSIRDLHTTFETLADHARHQKNLEILTRYVRKALGRGIVRKYLGGDNKLHLAVLDRGVEDLLLGSQQHYEDGSTSLNIDADTAHKLLTNISKTVAAFQATGTQPILMCGPSLRWDLYKLVSRFVPGIIVLAFDEIPSDIVTNNVGRVTL
jgi:flagellar biosynthesis protein FlhA